MSWRQIPIGGEPTNVTAIVEEYGFCRIFPNQQEVTVGYD